MSLGDDPPFKKRACDPEDHEFARNEHGFRVCETCELSRQSLTDQDGQDDLEVPPEVEVYPLSNPIGPVRLFSDDVTVFRGYVRNTGGNRMAGAKFRVTDLDFDLAAETDVNGRFVLYFEDAPTDDVEGELRHDRLRNPVDATLSVASGTETIKTLDHDYAYGPPMQDL